MKKYLIPLVCAGAIAVGSATAQEGNTQDFAYSALDRFVDKDASGVRLASSGWTAIDEGLEYSKYDVIRNDTLIDRVNVVRVNPEKARIEVHHSYDPSVKEVAFYNITEWQETTGASVVINSAQYASEPYGKPIMPMKSNGRVVTGGKNARASGMLVANPTVAGLPSADLLDIRESQRPEELMEHYADVVQHYDVLLDAQGNILPDRIKTHPEWFNHWQANRTALARDEQGRVYFVNTEGSFFTLEQLGVFFKDLPEKIVFALYLDGGNLACMAIRTPGFSKVVFGKFEARNQVRSAIPIYRGRRGMPGVITASPRKE